MLDDAGALRTNQARRTRKALLEAAGRLLKQGRRPSFEEVAEEALVSRATAYRYFAGIEPLLVETALDLAFPGEDMFDGDPSGDAVARVQRADAEVQAMIRANEAAVRTMLIHSLQVGLDGAAGGPPARQNRRVPLIEAALAPLAGQVDEARRTRLARALALVIGTEGMVVCRDVLRLGDEEADDVRRWMIGALIAAA
ncbi:MAG: TetR/AcrR family transcriptional regulator [Sphingomonadaceae bacterium]|nr:TetR/AcrR family transcriptional regulator [Sphingomonadaceae bacterium]